MGHPGDYVKLTGVIGLAHDVSFVHTEMSQFKDKEGVFA